MHTALVVDDEEPARLAEFLECQGYAATTAATFASARGELRRRTPDLTLLDVLLPDGNGLDLLLEIPSEHRGNVLLISGDGAMQGIAQRLQFQNLQFLAKPVDLDELDEHIRRLRRQSRRRKPEAADARRTLIGSSAAMREVLDLVDRVAPTDFPVYVEGESGTGKELIARAVHDRSRRSAGPFVAINCGALPEGLIDSELFGHRKGAFTGAAGSHAGVFEQAAGGTLFLDELAEMPLENQVRLLRVLETGRVKPLGASAEVELDVRIVVATNRPAERALADGQLREDLYHRLAVFPIHVPPLRERPEDIEELVAAFAAEAAEHTGVAKRFTPDALERLVRYRWPGNVRQLRNAVQRAHIVADSEITPSCLPPPIVDPPRRRGDLAREVGTTIADAERRLIEATLERCSGDKKAAAHALGISLRTLYNRLKEYGAPT